MSKERVCHQVLDQPEKFAGDEHSSLFFSADSDDEKAFFKDFDRVDAKGVCDAAAVADGALVDVVTPLPLSESNVKRIINTLS